MANAQLCAPDWEQWRRPGIVNYPDKRSFSDTLVKMLSTPEEERLKAMTPAERDLTQLRQRLDPLQTTVIITGAATESAALHRYLGEMDANNIFAKAELDSFASVDNGKGGALMQFRATLVVRPGYGQAGGPTAPPKKDVAQNHREQPPKTSP